MQKNNLSDKEQKVFIPQAKKTVKKNDPSLPIWLFDESLKFIYQYGQAGYCQCEP